MYFEKDKKTEQEIKQGWERFYARERQQKQLEVELVDFLNSKDVSYRVAIDALDDVVEMLKHQAFMNKI